MSFNMHYLFDDINPFHLLDIKNPMHPSMFVQEASYDILIVTLPSREEGLKIDAYAFVFDEQSYYYFDRSSDTFADMKTMQGVYELLNEKTNITMQMVTTLHESIDWMEEQLYENNALTTFMRYWLNTKKDLSRINRMLSLATDVLENFIQTYLKEEDFLAIHFRDIHEHLSRTNRSVLLAIDKLSNIYNFYISRNNERMNKMIYFLTIVSAIFLPLNLIVGYFGMNTQNLPLSTLAMGSWVVMSGLGVCTIVMVGLIVYVRKRL